MQHPEALRVVRQLGPELAKEAAETVLLRYAESEDLAPAQLEKLAQVYNMVRQLSHIDASEDRGSTCHQVDTPQLLTSYAGGVDKAASAPVLRELPTHDASIDLMWALRQDIAGVTKAAADMSVEITRPEVPAPSPEADIRFTPAQIKDAAWEAKVDLYAVADQLLKMASRKGRHLQLADAEHDAIRQVNPVCVTESLNWLAKYAGQQKISSLLARHEGPARPSAFPLVTPLSAQVVKLAEAFTVTTLFHKMAGMELKDIPNAPKVESELDPATEARLLQFAAANGIDTAEPSPTEMPAPGADPTPPSPTVAGGATSVAPAAGGDGGGGGQGDSKGGKGSGEKSPGAPPDKNGKHWLASLISGATKPLAATADAVGAVGDSAKNTVKTITDKERLNKHQISSNTDIADIKRSILIRRLAANDPVLRDMPLKEVLDTYNAIAEINPEAAANPRRVLLAMREASSYDGLTLDSQKLLGDVRGAAAKTEGQEHDNTQRRYSV